MASIKFIKRRIKAAKNISQITKAMEMVAASKMRKSQAKALAGRPYANKMFEVLTRMSAHIDPDKHVLLQTPKVDEVATIAILVISPDKGLCGSLSGNLMRQLETLEKQISDRHADMVVEFKYITIGKKAREYVVKTGRILHSEFTRLPDRPAYEEILPIAHILISGFTGGEFYKVYVLYTDFINTLSQRPTSQKLLPIDTEELTSVSQDQSVSAHDYLFEPSADTILEWLLPYYFELSIYQKILESQASEHSARMVAMRNASDNAKEILQVLRLEFNRKRQSAITNELLDIVTSRTALS